jgi:hypothetical protein
VLPDVDGADVDDAFVGQLHYSKGFALLGGGRCGSAFLREEMLDLEPYD